MCSYKSEIEKRASRFFFKRYESRLQFLMRTQSTGNASCVDHLAFSPVVPVRLGASSANAVSCAGRLGSSPGGQEAQSPPLSANWYDHQQNAVVGEIVPRICRYEPFAHVVRCVRIQYASLPAIGGKRIYSRPNWSFTKRSAQFAANSP